MNDPSRPEAAAAPHRPPDFLLPKGGPGAARPRAGQPEIYLSWGGAIYGPAGSEEVLAGVRSAWFEADTLFWFEGQTDWLPVDDFPGMFDAGHHTLAARRTGAASEEAPPSPAAGATPALRASSAYHRRGGRNSKGKSKAPRRHNRSSKVGRLIAFVFVILIVIITVGLTFLLMQF